MNNLDLHMLRVLSEIYRTGSLSRTADHLRVTQPSVSMVLAKLREHFGDPLFVRVGHAMRPTPQAIGMRTSVESAIAALDATLSYRSNFDPATSARQFRIAVTDIGQVVFALPLFRKLAQMAPQARLEFSSITEHTPQLLETGRLDLAIGPVPNPSVALMQQTLYRERFSCLTRVNHPRICGALNLDQFTSEGHVVVVTASTTHIIHEKNLEAQKIHRVVAVRLPNFMLLRDFLAATDYLATVPCRAADALVRQDPRLAAFEPPIYMPEHSVNQYWHESQSRDPGNTWLRQLIVETFSAQDM